MAAACWYRWVMVQPTLDLSQARRLMDALYQPGDLFYILAYEDKKGGSRKQESFTYDQAWPVGSYIEGCDRLRYAVATSLGVFEARTPGRRPRRTEDQCRGLSAFGIDVDEKDLGALVPGATTVEQVIPEVVRRLQERGIPPHALVRSGRGLHVYVFIERVSFADDDQRTRAKDAWYRLAQLLGGASDRYDLSSVLRVPGTLNRKGEPVRVEFVEEHTHLDRPRYTLEAVVKAVEHLPALPADRTVGKKRKRVKANQPVAMGARGLDQDPWNLHILGVALKLDRKLAMARVASMEGRPSKSGKVDRSRNDFAYACRLLELGVPEGVVRAELAMTARGRTETETWLDSTFRAATAKVYPTRRGEASTTWETAKSGGQAFFTVVEAPAKEREREMLSHVDCGEFPPAPSRASPPIVSIALARPGQGKTRSIVDWLASVRTAGSGRLGLCGGMVRELLRHEYLINAAFPQGMTFEFKGETFEFEPDLPNDHESLWRRLPAKLKERIDLDPVQGDDGEFQRLWTLEKLKAVVADPAAFYVNTLHPRTLDEGLEPYEDENGPVLPPWAASWDDPVLRQPRAVVKFRGRVDLCLANRSAKHLRDRRTCMECDFSACRANGNIRVGGAKTYWTNAPFALLTHQAYETHAVVKRSLNDFDSVVFDELPALVYRYPKLRVAPLKVSNGRAAGWEISPVESLTATVANHLNALDAADPKARVLKATAEPVLKRLDGACKKLAKKASDLMQKTRAGRLQRGVVQVDRLEPLLNRDDFAALLKMGNIDADEEADDDDSTAADPALILLYQLSVLRDFCGDDGLDVFMEADFNRNGEGSLWVCRPVNGWADLLNRPDGRPRSTVLLDASAGIDPRYLLIAQGDVEKFPDGDFPNTTLVLTSKKYVSKKKAKLLGAPGLAALLVKQVSPYLGEMVDPAYSHRAPGPPRLLVVTAKEMREALNKALAPFVESGKLPQNVVVEHFGGLRSRNDFRDFDAVYLTHAHLYDDAYFNGLELLLRDFGKPFDRQWVPKAKWYRIRSKQLQHRAQAADIYQDVMRIGIRSDPMRRAFIFLPTPEAGYVIRLLRMFRGARLILPDGQQVSSLLPAPSPPPPRVRAERSREVPDDDAGFGEPKHEFP